MRKCGRWSVTSSGWKGCTQSDEAGENSAARQCCPHYGGVAKLLGTTFRDRVPDCWCYGLLSPGIGQALEPLRITGGLQALRCLLYTSPSPRDRQKSRMP